MGAAGIQPTGEGWGVRKRLEIEDLGERIQVGSMVWVWTEATYPVMVKFPGPMTTADARELAAQLLRAADMLEKPEREEEET